MTVRLRAGSRDSALVHQPPPSRRKKNVSNVNFQRHFDGYADGWAVWESFPVLVAATKSPADRDNILESITFVVMNPLQHSPHWTAFVDSLPAHIRKAYLDGYALDKPGQWW